MDNKLLPLHQTALEKRARILHIDDDKNFLELAKRQLEAVDPDLYSETISDPENTLNKLNETRFHCVLCDYKMPKMDGIEVLRQIRKEYPRLPFILLTNQGSEEVASQAISENATDYIRKGGSKANYELIANRIENAISKRKAEEERENAFERMADAYFKLDNDWRFTYTNENATEILDRPREEIIGENLWELYPDAREEMKIYEKYHEAIETQEPVNFEEYLPTQDRWINVYAYPSEDGLSIYLRDITERVQHERQLEQYRRIVDTTEEMLYILNSEGTVEWINQEVADRLGFSREEIIGRDASEFVASQPSRIEDIREQLGYGEKSPLLEAELLASDGERLVVEGRFTPYEFVDGEIGRMGVIRETTQRKEQERELEQQKKALETITDGVYILDDERTFVFVNDAFTEITGYRREEIIGSTPTLVADEETIHVMDEKQEALTEEDSAGVAEFELNLADGTRLPAEIRFTRFQSEDIENGRIGVIRDITPRKEGERKLNQCREVIEAIRDGVYAVDENSRFIMVNNKFCEMLGYERDELLGEHVSKSHDIEKDAITMAEDILKGTQEMAKLEHMLKPQNDDEILVETRFVPFRVEEGGYGRAGVVREITERKEREKRLERFGEIISHDLKNPLSTAQGSLELIRESGDERGFEILENSLQKMANIVDDLQLITLTSGEIEKEEISLKNGFNEAYRVTGVEPSYSIEDMTLGAGETSFARLLTNLIINSVTHNEKPVHIEVGPLKNRNGFYYQDDGKGIPAEQREEVFNYGFTTSKTGSGLGLSIVKRIVEVNGWQIEVAESETGGARFNIFDIDDCR